MTINNPTSDDEECIALARQKRWSVEGQKEKGESGTEHYQLLVKTPQVRFSAVKKAFPRAHIEMARNVQALETYVHKEETRTGALEKTNEMYPSLAKTWDMFADWINAKCDRLKMSVWAKWSPDDWLHNFDKFVCDYIELGYVLETIGVNPQVRSSVKLYGYSIFLRSQSRRQTDRQTDTEAGSDLE